MRMPPLPTPCCCSSAGSNEAFVGALGNTLCVDNIRLEYDH